MEDQQVSSVALGTDGGPEIRRNGEYNERSDGFHISTKGKSLEVLMTRVGQHDIWQNRIHRCQVLRTPKAPNITDDDNHQLPSIHISYCIGV